MNRKDIQKKMSDKIYNIRAQYRNAKERVMTQDEFTKLLNKTDPVDIQFETLTYGSWERGDRVCPGDKYVKILSMDKDDK